MAIQGKDLVNMYQQQKQANALEKIAQQQAALQKAKAEQQEREMATQIATSFTQALAKQQVNHLLDSLNRAVNVTLSQSVDEDHLPPFALPDGSDNAEAMLRTLNDQFKQYSKTLSSFVHTKPDGNLVKSISDAIASIDSCLNNIQYARKCSTISSDLGSRNESLENAIDIVDSISLRHSSGMLDEGMLSPSEKESIKILKSTLKDTQQYITLLQANKQFAGIAQVCAFAEGQHQRCATTISKYNAIPKSATPKLALASLILGIASLVLLFLTGIPAVITGHIALSKSPQSRDRKRATTGLVLGYVGIALTMFGIIRRITGL